MMPSGVLDLPQIGLQWLIRLRWLAAAGQASTCFVAVEVLGRSVPIVGLSLCLAITLVSNLVAELTKRKLAVYAQGFCAALLLLDAATLTAMLYWTGGTQNPFTTFYLLHVAIAAILLPPVLLGLVVAACVTGAALLYSSTHMLPHVPSYGLWVAVALTSVFIALFVGQLSRELAEARRLAMRNAQFEALSTLAAGVAHELATPLGTIAVVSADLVRGPSSLEEARSDAEIIHAEVRRCRGILEKLGDSAARDAEVMPADLRAEELPEKLKPFLKPAHHALVRWQLPDVSLIVRAPEAPLLHALALLVKNAAEASGESKPIRMALVGDRVGVSFSVADEGHGMPEAISSRVGEPFFTTKEPGVGMGLGLFLVRTFVERMHGRLDIQSKPGVGTTVTFLLPSEGRI